MMKVIDLQKPTIKEVIIYFDQKGFEEQEAVSFHKEYEMKKWLNSKGKFLKNWRAKANERMWHKQKDNPYLRSKARLLFN
jgi:hypothetical protein